MSRRTAFFALWSAAFLGTLLYCYLLELGRLDWQVCFASSGGELSFQPEFNVRFGESGSFGMFFHAIWNLSPLYVLIGTVMCSIPGTIVIASSRSLSLCRFQILGVLAVLGFWCVEAWSPAEAHSCDWEGVDDELMLVPGLLIIYTGALAILSLPIGILLKRFI